MQPSVLLPDVSPGEILVAENMGPRWTPLVPILGGLVLDSGAVGQHHSIMAREYGVPAVVCAGNATVRIPDGAWVTVDGTAGTVEVQTSGVRYHRDKENHAHQYILAAFDSFDAGLFIIGRLRRRDAQTPDFEVGDSAIDQTRHTTPVDGRNQLPVLGELEAPVARIERSALTLQHEEAVALDGYI